MQTDYYEILGVTRDCDEKTLKTAFRKLAMQYHPDRNPGDDEAERRFKEIGEAYEILKDPQKRAAYDRYGHAAFGDGMRAGSRYAGGFGGGFSDIFEGLFGDMMGARYRPGANDGRERGADLSYNMEITLEEAYKGKTAQIRVPSPVLCDECNGSGAKLGTERVVCKNCHGAGRVRSDGSFFSVERTCPVCHGRGIIIENPCDSCHGQGRVQKERTLSADIPAGVEDGTRLRLANEGEAGVRGGPNGDLYIFLSVASHEFFQREGSNLYCQVPISMVTAALGGQFEVSTLDGSKARVKVPEGTQNGKQFRLKGKGMPVVHQQVVGDLYIHVAVETPQNLTKSQRELLQEFGKISNHENSPRSHGFFARMKEFFEGIGGVGK